MYVPFCKTIDDVTFRFSLRPHFWPRLKKTGERNLYAWITICTTIVMSVIFTLARIASNIFTTIRLCVKYYQIEGSPLSNNFRLSFLFLLPKDAEPTKLEKTHFYKKYFETKLGIRLYLEILYLKYLLFCSFLTSGFDLRFLCDLDRFE